MRRVVGLTVLVLVGIGVSAASAQVTDPANPRIHSVIGIVTKVSASSLRLRADNGTHELKIDQSTRVLSKRAQRNDLVWRERQHRIDNFVRVGDEALVTYRDDDRELTALRITIPPPVRRPNR